MTNFNEFNHFDRMKKFTNFLAVIPYSVVMAVFPIFSKHYNKSRDFFEKFFKESLVFFLVLILPFVILIVFSADKFILAVYGKNFAPAGTRKMNAAIAS